MVGLYTFNFIAPHGLHNFQILQNFVFYKYDFIAHNYLGNQTFPGNLIFLLARLIRTFFEQTKFPNQNLRQICLGVPKL